MNWQFYLGISVGVILYVLLDIAIHVFQRVSEHCQRKAETVSDSASLKQGDDK